MARPKGLKLSKETKIKMSKSHKGQVPWSKGKKFSKEHKEKIRLALLGRTFSEESKEKMRLMAKGDKNHSWKGGITKHNSYILIYKPNHPFATKENYVLEHRLVMEKIVKRYLKPGEVVHHINRIRDDNRIENLMLFENDSEHFKYHRLLEKV